MGENLKISRFDFSNFFLENSRSRDHLEGPYLLSSAPVLKKFQKFSASRQGEDMTYDQQSESQQCNLYKLFSAGRPAPAGSVALLAQLDEKEKKEDGDADEQSASSTHLCFLEFPSKFLFDI